jgi:hypothetical protein
MENMLMAELYKRHTHRGQRPSFYFLRDSNGNEIDLVVEKSGQLRLIELKAAKTFNTRMFSGMANWKKVSDLSVSDSTVVYLGEQTFNTEHGNLVPWRPAMTGELIT